MVVSSIRKVTFKTGTHLDKTLNNLDWFLILLQKINSKFIGSS